MKRLVPGLGELLKAQGSAEAFVDVQVPIARRDAAFLPVRPTRVFFNGAPKLLRRQGRAGSQGVHGARKIDADEHASNIKDDGAELGRSHVYGASRRATARRARTMLMI